VKFFFDHCVSERIVRAIACIEKLPDDPQLRLGIDLQLEHATERWPNGADDVDWIPIIARENQIIITTDHAQRKTRGKTQAEAVALMNYGAMGFYLSKGYVKSGRWDQVWQFFKYWPLIKEKARKANPGDVFDVAQNGNIDKKRIR
jgi:hypothetical protein